MLCIKYYKWLWCQSLVTLWNVWPDIFVRLWGNFKTTWGHFFRLLKPVSKFVFIITCVGWKEQHVNRLGDSMKYQINTNVKKHLYASQHNSKHEQYFSKMHNLEINSLVKDLPSDSLSECEFDLRSVYQTCFGTNWTIGTWEGKQKMYRMLKTQQVKNMLGTWLCFKNV